MAITRSYNRSTNTHYAYETTYEWDESKQRKVQRKRCIGHFDPITGDLVPNGKIGRPNVETDETEGLKKGMSSLMTSIKRIDSLLKQLSDEICRMGERMDRFLAEFEEESEKKEKNGKDGTEDAVS